MSRGKAETGHLINWFFGNFCITYSLSQEFTDFISKGNNILQTHFKNIPKIPPLQSPEDSATKMVVKRVKIGVAFYAWDGWSLLQEYTWRITAETGAIMSP